MSGKGLQAMGEEVYAWADSKGWNNPPPTFGEAVALLHSECSEALEAYRDHGLEDVTGNTTLTRNERHDLVAVPAKPEGVGSEFADVLIRLLHYSALFGVDLDAEYERKMAYNITRAYRHGGRTL